MVVATFLESGDLALDPDRSAQFRGDGVTGGGEQTADRVAVLRLAHPHHERHGSGCDRPYSAGMARIGDRARARSARRSIIALAVLTLAVVPVSACGSSGSSSGDQPVDQAANPTTTIDAVTTTLGTDARSACGLFADTVGLDGLVPKESDSWRDERERILIDARREAGLLRQVSAAVAPELEVALETVASYADFVADSMDASSSYTDALRRLDAFGDVSAVRTRDAEIDAWRDSQC